MAAGVNSVVSLTATGQSNAIPVNVHSTGQLPIGIVLDFTTGTGVGTCNAEFTYDDLPTIAAGGAHWFAFPNLSSKSATTMDNPIMPCIAVRLNVTAYTSGTITMRVIQGVL